MKTNKALAQTKSEHSNKGDKTSGTTNVHTVLAPIQMLLTSNLKLPAQRQPPSFENFLQITNVNQKIYSQEPILFSSHIKKSYVDPLPSDVEFYFKYEAPQVQAPAILDNVSRPGYVPLSTAFHMQSNRERIDDDDDGLDESDLTAADGVARKPVGNADSHRRSTTQERFITMNKRHSNLHEAIRLVKGNFSFPHRTYRPKVQVPFRVPPGQMPQAVVIERLHRLYRKTDIGGLCALNGITQLDLMAVPHYGETNERFYQEMQWRNRTRVNGVDKREFVEQFFAFQTHADSKVTVRSKSPAQSGTQTFQPDNKGMLTRGESEFNDDEILGEDSGHRDYARPTSSRLEKPEAPSPFGPMFPLDFFDNEEYDVRTGEEWMFLGWDWKDHKMYPIPAKAYLPIRRGPGKPPNNAEERQERPKAISEITADNLLTKTGKLEKFRRWLLTERYRRLTRDDASAGLLNDQDLLAFARASTTVPNLVPLSEQESVHGASTKGSVHSEMSDDSVLSFTKLFPGTDRESLQSSLSNMDVNGSPSDFWNQFTKVDKAATAEDLKSEQSEIKKSESLLSDVFSDPASIPASPNAAVSTDVAGVQRSTRTSRAKGSEATGWMRSEDQGLPRMSEIEIPRSPDIDPYEDGAEDLVFDYDKMKRVHNYDWQWVEVAVFKYDPVTRRYFVRSIYPPVTFAWLSKLYVLMDGEDPRVHVERLKDAIHRRQQVENIMRYNLYIDCLPTDRVKGISASYLRKILRKVLETPMLAYQERTLRRVQQEIDLEYQRTHLMLEFNSIVEKHPKLFHPWVTIPEPFISWGSGSEWRKFKGWRLDTGSFSYKKTRIHKMSVMYMKEPYEGLMEINRLCLEAMEKRMLGSRTGFAARLDQYEQSQSENITAAMTLLKNEWMEAVLEAVRKNLSKIPHSWYNINETRWDVYLMSKTCNYLTLVKFMMENALRHVTETSLLEFVSEIEEFTASCDVDLKYDWGEDLIHSEFPPPAGMTPPFLLELLMDKDGPKYTQLLSKFPKVLTIIFESCVGNSGTLPDIVPQIMTNLLFGVSRRLNSADLQEPHIREMQRSLMRAIRKGLYPVDKYAQKYKRYLSLWNLDLPKFLKGFESENHTATETRKIVEKYQAEYNDLQEEIPAQLDIACFRINTEVVRSGLLKKKKSIINGILDEFAEKLRNQVHKIREEYAEMERKLNNRSEDIQEVMDLKQYVETVPLLVQSHSEQMTKIMKDYEMFERFSYSVSSEDFENKWNTALWALRILKMAEDAVGWLDDDYDRLLKVQTADMASLSDAVDSATLAVSGLAAFVELERAVEVSQEVKKVWKQVLELDEQNKLLNDRQKIFGLPPCQNEALERLLRDIEPFKSLWFTAADYQRLQDIVFKETLDKIDVRAVNKLIREGGAVIRRCVRYFQDADTIQHIAVEVKHHIDEFKPIVPLIATLKNSGMRQRHWEAISDICGFRVVAKGNQNFKALLDQGLGLHVNEIAEIGELATNEFAIESKLEKMIKDLDRIKLMTQVHPTTGMVVVELLPETAMSTIDDFVEATEELLENPYRSPFEERLNTWEKKINWTKENLVVWLESQVEWMELQPLFAAPDAATRMPPEYKIFTKMERIWRRLNRLVRDKPDILEIGSDSTVRASLLQFTGLIAKVKKGLEEYMRPQGSSSDDDVPAGEAET